MNCRYAEYIAAGYQPWQIIECPKQVYRDGPCPCSDTPQIACGMTTAHYVKHFEEHGFEHD